jgi:hypothetical protein
MHGRRPQRLTFIPPKRTAALAAAPAERARLAREGTKNTCAATER